MGIRLVLCCWLCAFLSVSEAAGDPLTLNFTVVVEQTHGPLDDLFGVAVTAGDRLQGVLSYDPLARLIQPPLAGFALFNDPRGTIGLESLRVGSTSGLSLEVFDGKGTDPSDVDRFLAAGCNDSVPGLFRLCMFLVLDDASSPAAGATVTGFALPRDANALRRFPNKSFRLIASVIDSDEADPSHVLTGQLLLNDVAQPIPEPATLLLTSAGLIGIGLIRKGAARAG